MTWRDSTETPYKCKDTDEDIPEVMDKDTPEDTDENTPEEIDKQSNNS